MVRQKLIFAGNDQTKVTTLWKWSDKIGTQLEMVRKYTLLTQPNLLLPIKITPP